MVSLPECGPATEEPPECGGGAEGGEGGHGGGEGKGGGVESQSGEPADRPGEYGDKTRECLPRFGEGKECEVRLE